MLRFTFIHISVFALLLGASNSYVCADEATDKELKKLEGVWKSGAVKRWGLDHKFTFEIQGGCLGLRINATRGDGESSSIFKFFTMKVDLRQREKRLRLVQIASNRDEVENRLILEMGYEWDGEKLKILWDTLGITWPDGPIKKDEPIKDEPVSFARDKEAKTPNFTDLYNKPKNVTVKPSQTWAGDYKEVEGIDNRYRSPITTEEGFAKEWQALRGKEALPKIDFKKELVIINYTVLGKIDSMELNIINTHKQVEQGFTLTETEKKREGVHYRICVFSRELIDVVDGKIVPKSVKKKE